MWGRSCAWPFMHDLVNRALHVGSAGGPLQYTITSHCPASVAMLHLTLLHPD